MAMCLSEKSIVHTQAIYRSFYCNVKCVAWCRKTSFLKSWLGFNEFKWKPRVGIMLIILNWREKDIEEHTCRPVESGGSQHAGPQRTCPLTNHHGRESASQASCPWCCGRSWSAASWWEHSCPVQNSDMWGPDEGNDIYSEDSSLITM